MEQDQAVVEKPLVDFFGIDMMMHGGIVKHHDCGLAIDMTGGQLVDEGNDLGTFDTPVMQDMLQDIGRIVERPQNVYPLTRNAGVGFMWLAQRRPGALDIGYGRQSRFIEEIQMKAAFSRGAFQFVENRFFFGEGGVITLFFNDRRQRL